MQLTPKDGGFSLDVKVVPGASRTQIVGAYAAGIKITVAAAAHEGAANKAVIDLLAETCDIPRTSVRILRGHSSPRKEVLIVGLLEEMIKQRLLSAK